MRLDLLGVRSGQGIQLEYAEVQFELDNSRHGAYISKLINDAVKKKSRVVLSKFITQQSTLTTKYLTLHRQYFCKVGGCGLNLQYYTPSF